MFSTGLQLEENRPKTNLLHLIITRLLYLKSMPASSEKKILNISSVPDIFQISSTHLIIYLLTYLSTLFYVMIVDLI